jgi:hypothetical protein
MAESLRAENALHLFIQLVSCSPRTLMGSLWLLEYRPAVVPAPAGPFRSLELLLQTQTNQATREIVQEDIRQMLRS